MIYDVIQIGYGPVSETLALMLGRQGRSVVVCEKWRTRYPLPRAVCIDHELYRVLAANGMAAVLPSITHGGPVYRWFNADWRELLAIDWAAPSISGGPEVNFVHQPTLELALDDAVRALGTVELELGLEAVRVSQDAALAHVELRDIDTGHQRTLSARYVIGCDGANSLVRGTIGGALEDRGFEADWLVIDVLLKPGVTIEQLGIPAAAQYCNPDRPTTIVPAGVRDGQTFRRWEFMRLPGESIAEMERVERVWELLSPWAGPDHVELVRHKVYNFRSLIAQRWRDGRLLIAGDAAHVMPPFMGQGMCSGIRDAANLAWKLGLILDGRSDDRLLDTYQAERQPHVQQITDISIYLGKIICVPDHAVAEARDRAFLEDTAPPPQPFPCLTDGLIRHKNGVPTDGAGRLAPHVDICVQGKPMRLDEHAGGGFFIVTIGNWPPPPIDTETADLLAGIGWRYVALGNEVVDLDGRLSAYLQKNGWHAIVVRPDFYIYGAARDGRELLAVLADLRTDLTANGLKVAPDRQ